MNNWKNVFYCLVLENTVAAASVAPAEKTSFF